MVDITILLILLIIVEHAVFNMFLHELSNEQIELCAKIVGTVDIIIVIAILGIIMSCGC